MTLTAEQLAKRGDLGASDLPTIVCGDAHDLLKLYRVKLGLQEHDDLSRIYRVQKSVYDEPFNLDWHEVTLGYKLIERGEVYRHPEYDWLTCTLDAYDPVRDATIECKSTGWSADWAQRHYASQIYAQRACRKAKRAIMLLCVSNNDPVEIEYDFDQHFYDEIIARASAFKICMETQTEPVALPKLVPPEKWRTIDLINDTTLNQRSELIEHLECWVQSCDAAAQHEQAADAAKLLVPPDVGRLLYHDIKITRDKRGHLSIRRAA